MNVPAVIYKEYFEMLDTMQEIGDVNMFGAPAKLREVFPNLGRREAMSITSEWMQSKND
jgi:hypothetical protein|tara:strand:+ start:1150 stop:1326 length:177 start_codon:yes stop_codon:yes gene_type:complete